MKNSRNNNNKNTNILSILKLCLTLNRCRIELYYWTVWGTKFDPDSYQTYLKINIPRVMKTGLANILQFFSTPLSNSLFTVLFAYFVVRDLCRCGCRQNYYLNPPPPLSRSLFFSLPTILCLTQVTVI